MIAHPRDHFSPRNEVWVCAFNFSLMLSKAKMFLMATGFLAFTLPQVADTSSVSHAMSPTLKSPAIIAIVVCSFVRDSSRSSRCSSRAHGGR